MASLTRLSVLVADNDMARSRETANLLRELGVQHVSEASDGVQLAAALRGRAFDVLLCAEHLASEDASSLLRAARKSAPATRAVLMRSGAYSNEPIPSDVEAIELPLSRASVEALLQQTASPHGGLWCEVPALSLSDILQMYHQARRSITVLLSGPVAGRVRLDAGEIVDAEMGNERGMAALSRLLEAESGLIRTAASALGAERTIDAPFQSVLLQAAQKLDERRRDDMLANEVTSVSADVLRPSVPLSFQAYAPDPKSFLAPPQPIAPARRRWGGALAGVALGSALAVGVAFYLKHERPRSPETLAPEGARVEQSVQALTPTNLAPPPAERELPRPAAVNDAPAASPNGSFTLRITSKPPRALVLEAGKVLGKTPLEVEFKSGSVAKGPRRFSVRHAGYVTSRLVQGASSEDVSTLVVLQPRSAPSELPDAGHQDSEGATGGSRSRRKDPSLRTRR